MLRVTLPSSHTNPLVRVTIKSPVGQSTTMLDDSHSTLEVPIPNGVREDQIEVTAQLCDAQGVPDKQMEPMVLKAASEAAVRTDPRRSRSIERPAEKIIDPSVEKTVDTSKPEVPQL